LALTVIDSTHIQSSSHHPMAHSTPLLITLPGPSKTELGTPPVMEQQPWHPRALNICLLSGPILINHPNTIMLRLTLDILIFPIHWHRNLRVFLPMMLVLNRHSLGGEVMVQQVANSLCIRPRVLQVAWEHPSWIRARCWKSSNC
jgi:hypothetical protein